MRTILIYTILSVMIGLGTYWSARDDHSRPRSALAGVGVLVFWPFLLGEIIYEVAQEFIRREEDLEASEED